MPSMVVGGVTAKSRIFNLTRVCTVTFPPRCGVTSNFRDSFRIIPLIFNNPTTWKIYVPDFVGFAFCGSACVKIKVICGCCRRCRACMMVSVIPLPSLPFSVATGMATCSKSMATVFPDTIGPLNIIFPVSVELLTDQLCNVEWPRTTTVLPAAEWYVMADAATAAVSALEEITKPSINAIMDKVFGKLRRS